MVLTKTKKELIEVLVRRYIKGSPLNVVVASKGRKLLVNGAVQLRNIDYENARAEFSVESQSYQGRVYGVTLSGFDSINMNSTCSCPYDEGDFCKHEIAAITFFLHNLETPQVFELSESKIIKPLNVITETPKEQPENFYLV